LDNIAITSKSVSCLGCSYNKKGNCNWFPKPRSIPYETLMKGCKYRMPKVKQIRGNRMVEKLIDLFDGELL